MKQYNKTHCPDSIEYNGEIYKMDIAATHEYREGVKLASSYHIRVNVLSKNLKGRTDLHGNLYKANIFIYSNELGLLRSSMPVKTITETRKGKIVSERLPNTTPL